MRVLQRAAMLFREDECAAVVIAVEHLVGPAARDGDAETIATDASQQLKQEQRVTVVQQVWRPRRPILDERDVRGAIDHDFAMANMSVRGERFQELRNSVALATKCAATVGEAKRVGRNRWQRATRKRDNGARIDTT